jgi:hypothetical protein
MRPVLKVGGEWATAMYDSAIPDFLNKHAKKWGAKVSETKLLGGKVGGLKMREIVHLTFAVKTSSMSSPASHAAGP